ncbi:MAG: glycerophosphodiester phosphodiesterase family protein [Elusimicrobiota bacterium]
MKKNDIYRPLIIAHRGARYEAPENTRSAFNRALEYVVDGIEFDVQLSRDGVPVLYHDRTLAKISGNRTRISDHKYRELKAMDFGSWFSGEYKGERIMKLSDMLDSYKDKTRMFLEIKSRKTDRASGRSEELGNSVLELVGKRPAGKRCPQICILSFDPELLNRMYREAPANRYVLNITEPLNNIKKDNPCFSELYGFSIPVKRLDKKFADDAHRAGYAVMTYACNVSRQLRKALDLKADVIMTDNPGWLTVKIRDI